LPKEPAVVCFCRHPDRSIAEWRPPHFVFGRVPHSWQSHRHGWGLIVSGRSATSSFHSGCAKVSNFRRFSSARAVSARNALRLRGPTSASISAISSVGKTICIRCIAITPSPTVPYLCVQSSPHFADLDTKVRPKTCQDPRTPKSTLNNSKQ